MTDNSFKKISRILALTVSAALVIYVIYVLSDLIVIVAVSILLSFIFDPFVSFMEKKGFNRFTSTMLVFLGFGFVFYLVLSMIIPKFIVQMNQLIQTLHGYSLQDQIMSLEQSIYKFLPFFTPGQLSKHAEEFISTAIINSFDQMSALLSSIVSIAAIMLLVPFITFFILKDSRKIFHSMLDIIPNNYFEMSYWIFKNISRQLGRFVRGWIFDAAFVGIACGFGFYIIGIENALPLGMISGLGHLVPYFGPVIGGIPAIIISIIQYGDLSHVPLIVGLMIIVYIADNGFVQPYVFAKSVDMHPIVIILLILAGSQVFGILGMLLAVPTVTVIRTAAKEIYFAFKNYRIARL